MASMCLAIAALPTVARADTDLQLSMGPGVSWIRSMPSLSTDTGMVNGRHLPAKTVPMGGPLTALGGNFDLGLTVDDHWMIPMFGFGAYAAVGDTSEVLTSIEGSIVHVRPWSTFQVDALFPGLGYRFKRRRWMFSGSVRMGLTYLETGGTVASGTAGDGIAFSGSSFDLQAEIGVCRRLDPEVRACLQVAPRLYDFSALNGGTISLRMEWGR